MENRRKEVGQLIKATRRTKKMRSQKALADHVGVHETSVANAETGSSRVGEAVYQAIEGGLGWPHNSIMDYIEGRQPALPGAVAGGDSAEISEAHQKIIAMSERELAERIVDIAEASPQAAISYAEDALRIRREHVERQRGIVVE
ncbi:helix-turn-helix domain-containing protein [Amycolatopsis sp. NPDC088138]|uniref:helix-turn-helix domain-containing protein n=1 Tax=Amycolatopsis sp. NPDC088138 TaxID=3363938 RepID=UPI003816596C